MTCCGGNIVSETSANKSKAIADCAEESEMRHGRILLASGETQYIFSAPSIHCGSCIRIIEKELSAMQGVTQVRVNLTLKRIVLTLGDDNVSGLPFLRRLEELGFPAQLAEIGNPTGQIQKQMSSQLLRAMAVAGFSAMNIMLLSVSTWSGADGATSDLFHLVSALIAVPTVAYSGQVFFNSAMNALRNGHLNMDVPISLAVLLALGMSLFETLNHGDVVYFDAAVSLLFFLLIGRYLDQIMRERARNAVNSLSRLAAKGGTIISANGDQHYLPIDEIEVGMVLRILPGDKIPVDGVILSGASDLDLSLVTGESAPVTMTKGNEIQAGTHNLTGFLQVKVLRPAAQSFLAEVSQMLAAAENGKGAYVRIADRMAKLYAPAVHLLALLAFIWWMFATAGDWQQSLYVAIAVLIITCPCALGLAVPVVHVIGAGRLFEKGILMKDGSALERLAEIDHVIFDKTGTLTQSMPGIVDYELASKGDNALLATLAAHSSHPASKAIAKFFNDTPSTEIADIHEVAGKGVEGKLDGKILRLGKFEWVSEITEKATLKTPIGSVCFAVQDAPISSFVLSEKLRDGAKSVIDQLRSDNLEVEILSGDKYQAVCKLANQIGIKTYKSEQSPRDKIDVIYSRHQDGKHVLMVGDGLNDAPSLAAGHASMAPASASDIGRLAADFVFTRQNLEAIPIALKTARKARTLIKQNFGLAIAYNCIAVPLAFSGYVTPLFAAIAMSASSLVVILNSLRLTLGDKKLSNDQSRISEIEPAGEAI